MNATSAAKSSRHQGDVLRAARRPFWGIALIILAILWFAVPRLVHVHRPLTVGGELYDPRLASINSVDAAQKALPAFVRDTGHPQGDIADGIQWMLASRFAHGFPRFSVDQNWIAYLAGRLATAAGSSDDGYSKLPVVDSPVRADEIFKQQLAMCTQQMLMFEALLARNHIEFARVSFMGPPSHDAVSAKVDGVWRYYDSDMKPTRTGVPLALVLKGDILPAMYPMSVDGVNMGEHFRQLAYDHQIIVRDVNRYPASRGAFVQALTETISRWGWIVPLAFGAWFIWQSNNPR